MTWKDLQKLIQSSNSNPSSDKRLDILRGKPFWIWDKEEHKRQYIKTGGCDCFNHIIGLPKKNSKQYPLFDYELKVIDALEQHKRVWIKKSTGLGITELMIRYMAFLCLHNDDYQGSTMCIITAPNSQTSIGIVRRVKKLFEPLNIYFDSKETVLELNGVRIESFPSHNLSAMRSLPNVSFILADEADFWPNNQQQEVRDVIERYIGKSGKNNIFLAFVSTPNAPGGLFENIENEPEDSCLYHRIKLDYKVGLGKIYTEEDIVEAQKSPSFDREYKLKYLGRVGNVFSTTDLDNAIELGKKYTGQNISKYALHCCGVDWGFGSSKTVAIVVELDNEKQIVRVIRAKEWINAVPSDIARELHAWSIEIKNLYFFADGSNRGAINELKICFDEDLDWERAEDISPQNSKVIPVNFNKDHKNMLYHTFTLLSKGHIAISPKYEKLILSLRSAWATDFSLDKNVSVENDWLDAFRLLLKGIEIDVDE